MNFDDEGLISFLKQYNEAKKTNKGKLQYNLNIIDELHANENAHTRLLISLLDYDKNGKKPILENFVQLLNKILKNNSGGSSNEISTLSNPIIDGQHDFIDALITSKNDAAIIIENKIQWAVDQDKQIERYIESVKNDFGGDTEQIFVVYLTDNGYKKICDYSLTENAKDSLDFKSSENPGRFIELNYKDHILPFLKETLCYLDFSKETLLKAALIQYIDYFEGRYNMRENDKEYNEAMNKSVLETLHLDNSLTPEQQYQHISEIQSELSQRLDAVKNAIYKVPDYINRLYSQYDSDMLKPFGWSNTYQNCDFLVSNYNNAKENIGWGIDFVLTDNNSVEIRLNLKKGWAVQPLEIFNEYLNKKENEEIKNYFLNKNKCKQVDNCLIYTEHFNSFDKLTTIINDLFEDLRKLNK